MQLVGVLKMTAIQSDLNRPCIAKTGVRSSSVPLRSNSNSHLRADRRKSLPKTKGHVGRGFLQLLFCIVRGVETPRQTNTPQKQIQGRGGKSTSQAEQTWRNIALRKDWRETFWSESCLKMLGPVSKPFIFLFDSSCIKGNRILCIFL